MAAMDFFNLRHRLYRSGPIQAWLSSQPTNIWGGRWEGWEKGTTWTYRLCLRVLERTRPVLERPALAVRAWRGESSDVGGWRLVGYRAKASMLALVGPIRWHYPDYPASAVQVTSWNHGSYPGAEQTCYEWDEMHVGYGWNFRLYVCRETAP